MTNNMIMKKCTKREAVNRQLLGSFFRVWVENLDMQKLGMPRTYKWFIRISHQ